MSDDFEVLFADRPETIYLDGVGEVPVEYAPEPSPPAPVYPLDRLRPAVDVASLQCGDELVLFQAEARAVHILNSTAALLWQCVDGEGTVAEIFADVADAFGVGVQAVEHDFVPVVSQWKGEGLVVDAGSFPAPSDTGISVIESNRRGAGPRFLADPPND